LKSECIKVRAKVDFDEEEWKVDFTTSRTTMINNKLIKEIPSMHDKNSCHLRVVKKIPLLRKKYNPSSVGTERLPNL
jgi:hypothetical protein